MTFLVRQQPEYQKPAILDNDQHGGFEIKPYNQGLIYIKSRYGVVVNGLVYQFEANMVKHPTGWRFQAVTVESPKLPTKERNILLASLSDDISAWMTEHPEIMLRLEHHNWERKRAELEGRIRNLQRDLINTQMNIESYQRTLATNQDHLHQTEDELAQHMKDIPEGMVVEESEPAPTEGQAT